MWVNNHIHVLKAKKESNKFLSYCFKTIDYQSNVTGSTRFKLTASKLMQLKVLLPTSLSEQQQIASILSVADSAIEQTEYLIEKYKNIKKGLMQDLLTKGIDNNGVIRSQKTHKFKNSPLGSIPIEWECVKIGEMVNAIDAQPDHRTPESVNNGVPYLGISDIKNKKIIIKNCRLVGQNVLEKQKTIFSVSNGDFIFGKIGTIGQPKLLPDFQEQPYAISANVILIKPHQCPLYVYYAMISEYMQKQIEMSINTTSQPAFGMTKIRELYILKPLLEEQNKIVEVLEKIDHQLQTLESSLKKQREQKLGLMDDLLTGRVRVNKLLNN